MIIAVIGHKGGTGKSTTAIHLAAYCQGKAPTLLIDSDLGRSCLGWANRGSLPFKVVDVEAGEAIAKDYQHIILDTPARISPPELRDLSRDCDLLILPSTPDIMALSSLFDLIGELPQNCKFKVLLTMIPPVGSAGEDARDTIVAEGIPIFAGEIRRLGAFQKAALLGVVVSEVKGEKFRTIAWHCYRTVGREMLP